MIQSSEGYWNISNQINSRKSQTSILYIKFPVFFFAGERYMETPATASMRVQRIAGALSKVSIQNVNHLQVYFCWIRPFLIFLTEGRGATFVAPARVHRKYHISMYFLGKVVSHFLPKEKISCLRGKIPSFQTIQERSCPSTALFEKTNFSESLKKISYFRVFFFEKEYLSFSA